MESNLEKRDDEYERLDACQCTDIALAKLHARLVGNVARAEQLREELKGLEADRDVIAAQILACNQQRFLQKVSATTDISGIPFDEEELTA